MTGPAIGARSIPTKACPVCGDSFFTQIGLDAHVEGGVHSRYTRRWVTGRFSPAGLEVMRAAGRNVAALNNSRRRRCNECPLTTTPAALGAHQKSTGHIGYADVS